MANREVAGKSAAEAKPARQRTSGSATGETAPPKTATEPRPAAASGAAAASPPGRALTITVPLDRAINIAELPVAAAGRVLTAKGGLPIYVGLGVLAVADMIDWPVAAAAGAGYAILRRWGPLRPAQTAARTQKAE